MKESFCTLEIIFSLDFEMFEQCVLFKTIYTLFVNEIILNKDK